MDASRLGRGAAAGLVSLILGCGNWQRVNSAPLPSTEREVIQMFDANGLFTRLGRLVSTQAVPYVGSIAFVAGPGDSTVAIVGISLANHDFSFERNPAGGFGARYRVEFEFDQSGKAPVLVGRDQQIRVATFQETTRSDESVLEQQRITLAPGNYQAIVRVRDLNTGQTGTASRNVTAPVFGPNSATAPILVYRVTPRASRNDSLPMLLNARGTVAYGGDTLLIFIEGNQYQRPTDLPLEVRDERDSVVLRTSVHFDGSNGIETRAIKLAPDSAPLGQLRITLGNTVPTNGRSSEQQFALSQTGDPTRTTNALVSFSSAWVVTNFDDLLSLLRYFGEDRRLEAMRRAKSTDRIQLWQDFYRATDPNPATPENEALDQYFARIAVANQRYRETGVPGWRTNRGEVFIVLGEPNEVHDQSAQLQNNGRVIYWEYTDVRLGLYFQDISGFGHFELTPQSRSDFDRIRIRVQSSRPGGTGS